MGKEKKEKKREESSAAPSALALAALETNSVAAGILAADEAVKSSSARLLVATAVCAGKYFFCITGTAAAVRASLDAGRAAVGDFVHGELYLARKHDDVVPAMMDTLPIRAPGALGMIESYSAIASIEIADRIAKAYPLGLREIAVARGLGGKSFLSFTGDVQSVRLAAEGEGEALARRGLLVNRIVLERPALVPPLMVGERIAGCSGC